MYKKWESSDPFDYTFASYMKSRDKRHKRYFIKSYHKDERYFQANRSAYVTLAS